nr:hypothetical protein [uncultured bacterium]
MSDQERGARCRLIIQKETEYKTDPVAPDAQLIYFSSETISMSRGQEESDIIRGNRNPTRAARGNNEIGGDISTELQAYIGQILLGVLGSVATVGAASPYTHTFKIGDTIPSFLIEKGFPTLAKFFKYNGIKFGKLSFDVTSKGFQKLSLSVNGAKETIGATSFDATATDLGKTSFDGRSIATIEEGGVAIATISKITGLTIDNGLDLDEDNFVLGGNGERDAIPEGYTKVSGTVTALFKDVALYTKAINDTESSLRVVYSIGDGLGTAGNESLEIKIPELTFAPKTPGINGPKGLKVELPFVAYYDNAAEASAIQIILKNTQAII